MNSREIIDGMLRKKKVDRVGFTDILWPETLVKWKDEGYPLDENGNPVDVTTHLGFDLCAVGGPFNLMPLHGVSEVVDETDEWVLKRNGAGATLRWWKKKSGTPEHVAFHMTTREIWEKEYRPHLLQVDPDRLYPERMDILGFEWPGTNREGYVQCMKTRRDQRFWTFFGNICIWECMRQSMGDTCMYVSLVADKEWVHDYCRVHTDFFKAHYKLLIEEVGKPDGFWMGDDLGYRNGLFVSPQVLEEMVFPYYKEMVDFFHSYDMPVVLHTCGGITDALPLIVQAGFDALNPMEVKAGCDTLRFAEQYGDKLVFIGGLDVRVLESHDQDLIRKETIRLVDGMKARGARYVFGSDHSVSPNVWYKDYLYARDVYREHMMY